MTYFCLNCEKKNKHKKRLHYCHHRNANRKESKRKEKVEGGKKVESKGKRTEREKTRWETKDSGKRERGQVYSLVVERSTGD